MIMRYKKCMLQAVLLTTWISISYGCQMEGVSTWFTPVTTTVLDTHSGSFFNRATTNIVGINSITYGEGLNSGPYVQVTHSNSVFDITTNDAYRSYEENETAQSMTFTVVFGCTGGSTGILVFIIDVIDTNNNPPQFLPSDQFEFIVTPPLPPGYQITGCLQDITVRDIDLTTQRIEFAIEPNDYFEIDYDASLSTNPKEFKAILRTTTFLRTLPESLELMINATDVDLTGDPPITTSAIIRIVADDEFQLPEEPVFSQPYYLARYANNQVTMDETITLQQGFDELVQFSLEGDHSRYFNLQTNGSNLSLAVIEPLSPELLREGQVIFAVRAEREFTSGATATVIVQMPEVLGLRFENTLYEGRIVDGTMEPLQLVLAQGFEEGFSVSVTGDSSALFTTAVQDDTVTLSLSTPPNPIEHSFISLEVSASNEFSTASAVVTLEVIRDDVVTPAFEMAIYRGSYETESGLILDQIVLVQGYDETVSFSLDGEHASYFEVAQNGPVVSITASPLPPLVLSEGSILLSLRAAKPRTVGANAAIYIELPPARDLGFESSTYIGTIEENNIILAPIIMTVGYGDDINFSLSGDYATYFNVSQVQNQISIIQSTPLPQDVVSSEDFLILTLSASGELTETASAVVLLEIIKLDTNTPVFSQSIYMGSYSGMNVEIGNISLVQGYDTSVTFRLDGEHSQYFDISNTGNNNIIVTLASIIPEELVFDEKVLLFELIADKPLTVGANAVIAIRSPPELTDLTVMKFTQNTYIGSIENNTISLDSITLESGYNNATEFTLTGEYASYFTFSSTENVITISILDPIPQEVTQTNRYLVLELEAERFRAVSAVTSIIIHLLLPEVDQPAFAQPYYTGVYTEDSGLQFVQEIILIQGFDETVTFYLDGDSSEWFTLSSSGNSVTLQVNGSIPSQIIETNHQLLFTVVASKVGAPSGQTVISIELPKEIDPVILRFGQNSYVGRVESGELQSPAITLLVDNTQDLQLTISGEYANYFTLLRESNNVLLQLNGTLSTETEEGFIILNIEASNTNAITGYTTVVLDIVKDPVVVRPMFEQAYYVGEYSEQDGLLFEHNIQLIDGFDESVLFTLEGDDAQWFQINYGENESLSIALNYNGTLAVEDKSQLIFSVAANKLNSLPGRATIVIILSDYRQTVSLQFSQIFYKGIIENGNLTIEAITLDGYSAGTSLSLAGDYVNYFQLLNQDGSLSIELLSPLPDDVINSNTVLILTLEAATSTTRTQATIVIGLQKDEVSSLVFEETYYVGSYSESNGLLFNSQITLASGYEESVSFYLEGDDAQWFIANQTGNSVYLQLTAPISQEVLLSRRQLIFVIVAEKPSSVSIRASILIDLLDDNENWTVLRFERNTYLGSIQNDTILLDQIQLSQGYTTNVIFTLNGDESEYFELILEEEAVTILLRDNITEEALPTNRIILLELEASAPLAYSTYTTIVLKIVQTDDETVTDHMIFNEPYYIGSYSEATGLIVDGNFSLTQGYDTTVEFDLEGEQSQWFGLQASENLVTLTLVSSIPPAVILNNQQLIFIILAQKNGTSPARATIVISLIDDISETTVLGFNKISYIGSIENELIDLESVVLTEGYNENVSFSLHGELSNFFILNSNEEAVTITLSSPIPAESMPENGIIVLEIQASAPQSISAYATIVVEVVTNNMILDDLIFSEVYYTGEYTDDRGLSFVNISLSQGYDESVIFSLSGDQSQWFSLQDSGSTVSLILSSPIPSVVLANNQQLIFIITADKQESLTARATIVISLSNEIIETTLVGFNKISYLGAIENDQVNLEPVILSGGYNENVTLTLHGELASLFAISTMEGVVTITLSSPIPAESLPANRIIVLEIQASIPQSVSSYATIVFEVLRNDVIVEDLVFSEVYYTGKYTEEEGLAFESIYLSEGYDENITFSLEGENSQWFSLVVSDNSVTLSVSNIPQDILDSNQNLIFAIVAEKPGNAPARAVIIISTLSDRVTAPGASFERAFYDGVYRTGHVQHEAITLSGYNGTEIQVFGIYAELFVATISEGSVTVAGVSSVNFAPDVVYVALELRASAAATVLLLDVEHEDADPPTVTFGSTSYSIRTDVTQAGFVGRVEATASNGETVSYSLLTQDGHLSQRISVNQDGELHLSAPANSGVYNVEVVATTIFSNVSGGAVVHLTVDVITVCGDDTVVPPLIILDRDEEEPHRNLVIINEEHEDCRYSLTSRWPANQTWLYVDDIGLHANAIDREDASIAFMALSQIQVELLLECDSDISSTTKRNKRSVDSSTGLNDLGPYDYGDSSWILTDTILYNSRRTVVNLIVNDINDNYPIFIGKDNEPVVVGYPIPELEERVSPKALIELEATDADVGENAALVYWSSDEVLAVSPSSGLVHVRQNARLDDSALLSVFATDQNGQGLTGNLTLMVKLLDVTNIAVVTIRDAFLEDEIAILENLSNIVGYEVKALRATVVSDDTITNENASRRKRDVTTYGASLQIYVYGLIEREPVHVDRLTVDLTNESITTVNITRTVSLEDHLEEMRESSGRDTGLLVATIVLSVLLFILIVAVAVWLFLKWWKERNYEKFKDESSIASSSLDVIPGDFVKPQPEMMPRLNIEELIKSERRLQERLDAPDITVLPSSSKWEPSMPSNTESAVTVTMPDAPASIVIQDKLKVGGDESDDEDEFGERKKSRRKSVVTFNENVEKIIHVEETSDDDSSVNEVYKF